MKLSKKQILLVHNILFNHLITEKFSAKMQEVEDLMEELSSNLTSDQEAKTSCMTSDNMLSSEEDEDCYFDRYDDECWDEDEEDLDSLLLVEDLTDLEDILVFDCDTEKSGYLNFYWTITHNCCALITYKNGEEREITNLTSVLRRGRFLNLETANSNFEFEVTKFPKQWTSALAVNTRYGIKNHSDLTTSAGDNSISTNTGEHLLSAAEASDLDPVFVHDVDSLKCYKLNFFLDRRKLGVDLLDSRTSKIEETIPEVKWITRTGRELFLGLPDQAKHSRIFKISKFPKTWTSALDVRFKYVID